MRLREITFGSCSILTRAHMAVVRRRRVFVKCLMTPRLAPLVIFTGFAAALLADNYTPMRAVVWGTAWAITTTVIVCSELARAHDA